jgi:hypothetical protein
MTPSTVVDCLAAISRPLEPCRVLVYIGTTAAPPPVLAPVYYTVIDATESRYRTALLPVDSLTLGHLFLR